MMFSFLKKKCSSFYLQIPSNETSSTFMPNKVDHKRKFKQTKVNPRFFLLLKYAWCFILIHHFTYQTLAAQITSEISLQPESLKGQSIDSALIWLNDNYVDNIDNSFHQLALQTLAQAYTLNDNQLKGEVHLLLKRWHAYHVLFTIDSIYHHGEKAITLFKQTNDQAKLAVTCSELAFEYIDDNNLDRSEKLIFEAIAIYEKLGDKEGLGKTYQRMSSIYRNQKTYDLSIKYGLEALKMGEQTNNHVNVSEALLALQLAYYDAGELEKAIHAADKCIETINTFDVDDDFNLARAYGYRGDIWCDLGKYQNAVDDGKKAYAIIEAKVGAARPAAKTYRIGIGRAYHQQGNYLDALPHLEGAIDGYLGLGQRGTPKIQKLYNEVADCYLQLGDYKNAFEKQALAHAVFDTMMQNKVVSLESEALIKYETGKKDQAIEEQATIIEQKNRIQWLGIGMISLLVFSLSSLIYYFRRNQKTARELLVKNKENEVLLKEIHHRVKNNLQTISSLLNLQSNSISDPNALDAVQESRNRVASMAMIHQKLYQGENLAAIEMRDYFETIGNAIISSFGEKAKGVELDIEMPEMELDVDTAIPIGLITNELLTNSLKYAFTEKGAGKISISMKKTANNKIQLLIADDGRHDISTATSKGGTGFGGMLVQLLTQQLGGQMNQSTEKGTATQIEFSLENKMAA